MARQWLHEVASLSLSHFNAVLLDRAVVRLLRRFDSVRVPVLHIETWLVERFPFSRVEALAGLTGSNWTAALVVHPLTDEHNFFIANVATVGGGLDVARVPTDRLNLSHHSVFRRCPCIIDNSTFRQLKFRACHSFFR